MLREDLYKPWFVGEDNWGFEIISGDFLGVVLQIENFDILDKSNEADMKYHIINKPELLSEEDLKSEMFYQVVSTIINDILSEMIQSYKDEQKI